MDFFLKGVILGFAIAAPVGPIGLLCIRRTIEFGRLSGLFSGLGAAVADTFYSVIAAFGLTLISDFLFDHQLWLRLMGGVFLLYLGAKTFLAKPNEKSNLVSHKTILNDFVSTFFLTVSNPLTLFFYLVIFAGLGLSDTGRNHSNAFYLITGVFIGSCLWWLILSEGITLFRKKISHNLLIWINRLAGAFIVGFGLFALWTFCSKVLS